MVSTITEDEQAAYLRILKQGKNMIFLHHTIWSYQDWDLFENIVGGRAFQKNEIHNGKMIAASTYQHDVKIPIQIVRTNHPVTHGLENFSLLDEVYGGMVIRPGVEVLLRTHHPASTPEIGWTHRYENSQIVYIQPGHDSRAFEDPNYRQLVVQTIKWLNRLSSESGG